MNFGCVWEKRVNGEGAGQGGGLGFWSPSLSWVPSAYHSCDLGLVTKLRSPFPCWDNGIVVMSK